MLEIFIDGDACPVKDEIIRVAERHKLKINIASNKWMRFPFTNVEIKQIVVEATPDAADNWIADNVKEFDIVITSDIPLASRCLLNKAFVLRPNGDEYNDDNIGMALSMRELNSFLREIGEKSNSSSCFSKQDRSRFLSVLETTVQKSKRG